MKYREVEVLQTSVDESGESSTENIWFKVPGNVDIKQLPEDIKIEDLQDISENGPWYILYWLDKFNTLPKPIRDQIKKNSSSKLFNLFSESIAAIIEPEAVKDNSTIPVSDIASNITGYTYSNILGYRMTDSQKHLHTNMSVKTNNIFKLNMLYIKDDDRNPHATSVHTHGKNLITDSEHYNRLVNIKTDIDQMLQRKLGELYPVLKFIQNNISRIDFLNWKRQVVVENTVNTTDMNTLTTRQKSPSQNILNKRDLPS